VEAEEARRGAVEGGRRWETTRGRDAGKKAGGRWSSREGDEKIHKVEDSADKECRKNKNEKKVKKRNKEIKEKRADKECRKNKNEKKVKKK
jgi:hypothetical protein